ncbi:MULTISPECIES: hypothetical protein [unclassified Mesorhizobium]|uniref:hypothetical protein n=2 Tax=Mesorhizobium TaxID=68287 RepID=UPI000FCB2BCB|nr:MULTISPECIES: hypothetical protein [unclassified Mesorhizobium]TGU07855.1 hypothetical protein EN806_31415 [bacterium M00.F.Ca.ET.163.01.1.1]TGU47061.1 hypothetical protein EN789_13590 [bacterium M00.F.Ca.ET.146.01.1.1]TGW12711.1 hypothetical protein EN788_08115 [Mesorhizobium sp. M2D.F.Ca.ET.145.01.1.1]TGP33329.1 hypothetical protein EN875_015415 [Mesorhizobium sp. M2D.F.Ca.ET.232.01.1.1]TGP59373.1 hypothetical protein EN869_013925 [Mesorhizobium sp. M2D.F.Ca.ET.226.01.1.1]
MSNLTLAEATALLADPTGAVGFPSSESRDFDTTNNVVAFDKGTRISRISDAAQELVETERPNRKKHRAKIRDDGKSRLDIGEAAQLLVQQQPKKVQGRLTPAQGVDMLLGRRPQARGSALTKQEATELLAGGAQDGVARSPEPFTAPATTYEIEATNAGIALQRANADLATLESQLWQFVYAAAEAFPDVVADRNAVMRLDAHRFGLLLQAQDRTEEFGRIAERLYGARLQAWNRVVEVEDQEFQARNPDLDDNDSDRMAALLLAVMSRDEAAALASMPAAMISVSDPRVLQVLQIAAGSEDPETLIETLRDAGFSEQDIGAIAKGTAQAHLMDHRVREILLRASRNADFSEAAA